MCCFSSSPEQIHSWDFASSLSLSFFSPAILLSTVLQWVFLSLGTFILSFLLLNQISTQSNTSFVKKNPNDKNVIWSRRKRRSVKEIDEITWKWDLIRMRGYLPNRTWEKCLIPISLKAVAREQIKERKMHGQEWEKIAPKRKWKWN